MKKERRPVQVGDVYEEKDPRMKPRRRVQVTYVGASNKRVTVIRLNGPKEGTKVDVLVESLQTRWMLQEKTA